MKFIITDGWGTGDEKNVILLYADNWDDFGNKTTFHASNCDNTGTEHQLGTVKIGMEQPSCEAREYIEITGRTTLGRRNGLE